MSNKNRDFRYRVSDDTPLVDLNGTEVETTGIVTIIPAKGRPHLGNSMTFYGFKGRAYWLQKSERYMDKFWFGEKIADTDDGPKFKQQTLIEGRTLMLNNPADARFYHILRHHPSVEGSPNRQGQVQWKVVSEEKEAQKQFQKGKQFVDVYTFIGKMDDARLKSFSRLFHLDPENNSTEVLRGQLVNIAMVNPERFTTYLGNEVRTVSAEAFQRALTTGIISFSLELGYTYMNTIFLGTTEVVAIDYLEKHPDLLSQIDIESKRRDRSLSDEEKSQIANATKIVPGKMVEFVRPDFIGSKPVELGDAYSVGGKPIILEQKQELDSNTENKSEVKRGPKPKVTPNINDF